MILLRLVSVLCVFAALFSATAYSASLNIADAVPYPPLYKPVEAAEPTDKPDIVLIGADLVEVAVALGAAERILARPADIDLPGIENTPHKIREWAGVEGVLALRPALVVASSVTSQRVLDGLNSVGVQTAMIDRTLPATEKVSRLAALLKLEERGEKLNAAIEADYAAIEPVLLDGRKLRIVHASKMGAGTSFTAGGAETAIHNLILRVGALNAAAEVGRDRYRPVTPEGMIMMAPDVILISEKEIASFGGMDGIWGSYPGIDQTPAGRQKNVIVMRELHVRADAASSGIATKALASALQEMFVKP